MPSVKALFAQLVFKEFSIDEARDLSPHFRRFRVTGEPLRGRPASPGDKVQIMIGDVGPRTFTPFAPNPSAGTFDFIAYTHGDGPAATWSREAQAGVRFRMFGPRGSISLSSLEGPVVLFGDETSFGVAKSLLDLRGPADGCGFVFESTDRDEAVHVLGELGLGAASVVKRESNHAHAGQLEAQLRAALEVRPHATLVLTGHAQSIQAVRARLKAKPVLVRGQKVKAYWADGKRGLD